MRVQYFYGYVGDEFPNVPCGWRYVEAAVGRKWVRVREAVRWPTKRRKVSRETFDAMHMELKKKPKYLRKRRKQCARQTP
jgi:hypothetical protein